MLQLFRSYASGLGSAQLISLLFSAKPLSDAALYAGAAWSAKRAVRLIGSPALRGRTSSRVTSCPPRAAHRSEALNSSAKYSGDTKSSWPDSLPPRGTKAFALFGGLSSCSDSSRCSTEWLLQGACWLTNGALSMGVCHTTSREESR